MPELKGLEGAQRSELRLWLLLMQDGRCVLCGEGFDLSIPTRTYGGMSIEHKRPASRGGLSHRHNLALSHYECNCARGRAEKLKLFRPGPKGRQLRLVDSLSDITG